MIQFALIATLVAFQNTGGRAPLPLGATDPSDSIALLRRAGNAERSFLSLWENAWRASENLRREAESARRVKMLRLPWLLIRFDPRQADISCNPSAPGKPGVYLPDHSWGIDPKFRRVPSTNGILGVCPNWIPPKDTSFVGPNVVPDERLGIDGALDQSLLKTVRNARHDLIALMDSVVALMPSNVPITGQLVRMLVDQRELDHAERVARNCKAEGWWCSALTGYVLAMRGDMHAAEASYRLADDKMSDTDHCNWTDVSTLLDSAGRAAYSALACDKRDEFDTRLWWLTDPLWSVPGNDRLAEHFTRQMTATLHAATGRDERYNWTREFGGDALHTMILRYGWPSYTYWGPQVEPGIPGAAFSPLAATSSGLADSSTLLGWGARAASSLAPAAMYSKVRSDFLGDCIPTVPPMCTGFDIGGDIASPVVTPQRQAAAQAGPPAPPPAGTAESRAMGTTFEYSLDRVHAVPSWSAIDRPFGAKESDWQLDAPKDTVEVRNWWPQEHYRPAHPIMPFNDYQSAILRRDRGPLLAFATNLWLTGLGRSPADSVDARLLVSSDPGLILPIATQRRAATDRAVFLNAIPDRPTVVSVEVPWDSAGKPAGRARFGLTPPPSLSRMAPGDRAISEPVLLLAPSDGAALPNDAPNAIPFMMGATTLAFGTRSVGVYWETYGFAAMDTVTVTLRVQRQTALTLLEQAAASARLGANANTPVTMSWQEPAPEHQARTIAGAVPIQMRSVVLEISALRSGAYVLEISVGKPGETPVRNQRAFVVR